MISGTFGSGQAEINTRRLYISNQSLIGVRTSNVADERGFWAEAVGGFRLPPGLIQSSPLTTAAVVHRQIETDPRQGHHVLIVDAAGIGAAVPAQ